MSVESVKQFFQDFLNDPELVNDFTQNVNSMESGIQFVLDRGAQKGYQFSRQDVEESLPSLKSDWLEVSTKGWSDAGGISDGGLGAQIGEGLSTYIDDEYGDDGW